MESTKQMNNPTERDQQIARDANEKLWTGGGLSTIRAGLKHNYSIILAAIQDAKQQGNEDTARLDWLLLPANTVMRVVDEINDDWIVSREQIDAARGVQPAAKEESTRGTCPKCGLPFTNLPEHMTCHREAAQQESAPATEQETSGMVQLIEGVREQRWPHTVDARVWADEWERTLRDHPNIPTDKGCMIGWFANAIMAGYDTATYRAPSPAQDKPVAASVAEERLEEAENALRLLCVHHLDFDPSDGEGTPPREVVEMLDTRIAALCRAVEFARPYCEVHDPALFAAALSASSPSEQKSSLPAEL